jgi:hydroxypyruvate isomerase
MNPFALNLSMVYLGLPFLQRFDAAAAAGFATVEFWWPREEFAAGLTARQLVRRVRSAGLGVALLNFDGGDFGAGERGLAGVPQRAEAFRQGVPFALDLCAQLDCHRVNALAGRRVRGIQLSEQLRLLETSIVAAADLAGPETTITLEALNRTDVPGYLLPDSGTALSMVERVGRPNVGFQLDTYHLAIEGEDIVEVIWRAGRKTAHVQFADAPGRHEPGTGSVPFAAILQALARAQYIGAIGLEYTPSDPDKPDFSFLGALRQA